MIRIAYSGRSKPSALKIQEQDEDIQLIRDSTTPVLVNWGRYKANSQLNPDISNVTNKRVMRELFVEQGVPMPKLYPTVIAPSQGQNVFVNEDGNIVPARYPVVGRPDRHTKGRGLWLCNNWNDVLKALRGTRRKRAATHFMEYVEADREYRVHIFKGRSIRISEKVYTDETKKEYTTGKPGDIKLRRVREAAKLAVEAVGLDFGAVDILARGEQNEDVFVLEVNAAPGLGGTMPALYADTFCQWEEGQWRS